MRLVWDAVGSVGLLVGLLRILALDNVAASDRAAVGRGGQALRGATTVRSHMSLLARHERPGHLVRLELRRGTELAHGARVRVPLRDHLLALGKEKAKHHVERSLREAAGNR